MDTHQDLILESFYQDHKKDVYTDARLGKMVCEIKVKDEKFFFWSAAINTINKKEPTLVSVEGDTNGPNLQLLQKTYTVIADIEGFKYMVQKELDSKFADKKINLSKQYYIEDISLYLEDDLDFEIEFYSDDDDKPILCVAFRNNNIAELDLY